MGNILMRLISKTETIVTAVSNVPAENNIEQPYVSEEDVSSSLEETAINSVSFPLYYGPENDPLRHDRIMIYLEENIPTHTYKAEKSIEQCSICHQELETDAEVRRLPCNHVYHKDCIDQWFDRTTTCPNCRQIILVNETDDLSSLSEFEDDVEDFQPGDRVFVAGDNLLDVGARHHFNFEEETLIAINYLDYVNNITTRNG